MSLILISQCAKDLDFQPRKAWPKALPAMAWNYRLLTGFDRDEGLVFDLNASGDSFIDAFHSCYPELSLPELARFYEITVQQKNLIETQEDWQRFFELYQLRFQDSLVQGLKKLAQTPFSFQEWVSQKGVGPRDLEILKAVNVSDLSPLFEKWISFELSKSEGVQALEYATELFLLGKAWSEILPGDWTTKGGSLVDHLKKQRYPETSLKDESRSKGVRSLPWPTQIQAQWSRKGDQAGIEIRFRVSSLSDLNKKLRGLEKVEKALENPSSTMLWKN